MMRHLGSLSLALYSTPPPRYCLPTMRKNRLLAVIALSAWFVAGPAALTVVSQPYSISSEAIQSPGQALVVVRVNPGSAFIVIDGSFTGATPWSGKLTPGTHMLSVSAEDHFPTQFLFTVQENMKYTVDIRLEPYTGFLSIETSPSDASVYIDGSRVHNPLQELPIGYHTVLVKKFGFDEKSSRILILRNRTSTISVSLSPSIFEITSFRARPDSFNPENKGLYNRASVSFSVSAPGYGSIGIANSAGASVYSVELPVFRTWSQRFVWKGLKANGSPLPDGDYDLTLSLWPLLRDENSPEKAAGSQTSESGTAPEVSKPAVSFSTKIRIDSTRKILPLGNSSARPGLLYFADPRVREMLPGSVEAAAAIGGGATLSLGFKIDDATMLAIEGLYDMALAGGVAGSLLRNFSGSSGFDMAFFARAAWNSSSSPALPGTGSEAELAIPLAVNSRGLGVGLSPGLVYDMAGGIFKPRLNGALWFESQGLVAGISAMASFGPGTFPSSANPLLLAAEARILFDGAPFTMLFRISAAFEPDLVSPAAGFGFGVVW